MNRLRNFPYLVNVTRAHRRDFDGDAGARENEMREDTDLHDASTSPVGDVLPPSVTDNQDDNDNGVRRRSSGGEDDANVRESSFWDADDDIVNEERRRDAILNEIERSQRSNFVHFILLCLIPTSLLLIVVASVLGENGDCSGYPTSCANEPRSFINAFTTRCICDAVVAEP